MDKLLGGERLNAVLAQMAEDLGKETTLEVGFMSGATYPSGEPVAMIAAIQNFGAPESNIPARPFFTNMIEKESPRWADRLDSFLQASDYVTKVALQRFGYQVALDLQDSILDFTTPGLSPVTIAKKGFPKPLIDTGHMMNSVSYSINEGAPKKVPAVSL